MKTSPVPRLLANSASPHSLSALVCLLAVLFSCNPQRAFGQSIQQGGSGASARRFGFTITNTYGVSVSSTSTPGYKVVGEAQMGILPGSYITNQSSSTGVEMRSNGITVTGVNAGLTLNLDPDKTFFRAKLENSDSKGSDEENSDTTSSASTQAGTASVSAVGTATTTFTVESSETVTNNVFTKVF